MTLSQSLRSLLNNFNETRNAGVDPAAKQKVRDLIVKTFSDHGLRAWTEEFPSNNAQVSHKMLHHKSCGVDSKSLAFPQNCQQ